MGKLDILNREEFVDKLINLTENISENKKNTSFAINGTWGCGKSFVLDMYEERLSQIQAEKTATDKYFIVRYNCWKYDYYEEPLVAIVAAMIDMINQKTQLWNNEEKKERFLGALKAVGATLLSVANSSVKDKTGIDIQAAYKVVREGIEEGQQSFEKSHDYDVYFSFNQALKNLQKLISDIAKEQTIVIIVDELDRCLPEYSIKVLERLHHLTENIENVITVISIDKGQLITSINQIFGDGKAEKYLKKFMQFEIPLNKGVVSEKFIEKHADYIGMFDRDLVHYDDSIEEFMQMIFKDIDVREQEQLINRAMLVHKTLYSEPKDFSFMCVELLIIVMVSHYKDKKKFCDWFDNYTRVAEIEKENPPFARAFEQKIKSIPYKEVQVVSSYSVDRLVLQAPTSLYAAIAYIWFWLFLNGQHNRVNLDIEPINELLKRNIEELKKFSETIRFIR